MQTLIGTITDAEVKTANGKQVINFTLRDNDSYKAKDGEIVKSTLWINCSYWINPNRIKMLAKGKAVQVWGRVEVGAYINTEGKAIPVLDVHVNDFTTYGYSADTRKPGGETETQYAEAVTVGAGDDLPF